MKTGRYVVEAVFVLTAIFYGVSSSLNETSKARLKLDPDNETLTVPSNEIIVIYCYFIGPSDSARMEWIDPKGRVVPEGYHHFVQIVRYPEYLALMILEPGMDRSGKYTCLAEYNDTSDPGSIQKIEASINITVLDTPKIIGFQNVTVEEGGRAQLSCYAKSRPTPNITIWKADDRDFEENEDHRIEVKYFNGSERNEVTLTINQVRRSDEAPYYCIAEANGFSTNKTAYLEVQFAPNLTATPRQQLLSKSGYYTNITCIAEANPPAVITWKFWGQKIEPEEQYNVTYGHTVISKLLIYVNDTDEIHSNVYGIYKCTATNRLGSQSVNITVRTEPEYDVPGAITQVIFDRVTPRSILFVFMGPYNDGGKPIIAFVANYSKPGDHYHSVIEWPVGSSYVVSNLTPGENYTFNVAAKNAIGIGAWRRVHYIMPKDNNITTIEPNTLITKDVNITDYPDRYEIRWRVLDIYGMLKRYFVVTYFDDGRVKVDHPNGNTSLPF